RLARVHDPRPSRRPRARRADRRPGPRPAQRAVATVPRPRQEGHDAAGVEPRDGRGRPLRPAAVHPRGSPHRRRHPGRGAPTHRHQRPGGSVPPTDQRHCGTGKGGVTMSPRLTLSTAASILRQLRHDKRTIAMVLVVPTVLLTLLRYLYDAEPMLFDRVGLIMLGAFPLVIMFLLTSVAMLRERTSGTLERLLTTPIGKVDILLGYGIAFAFAAAVQAAVVSTLAYLLLGLDTLGPAWLVGLVAVGNAVLGMALGLL